MPGLSTPKANPFDVVQSADGDRSYTVPTISAVDEALRKLRLKIAASVKTPDKQVELRDDFDRLLERRSYLSLVTPTVDLGAEE